LLFSAFVVDVTGIACRWMDFGTDRVQVMASRHIV
jgi:hypothetical protein